MGNSKRLFLYKEDSKVIERQATFCKLVKTPQQIIDLLVEENRQLKLRITQLERSDLK